MLKPKAYEKQKKSIQLNIKNTLKSQIILFFKAIYIVNNKKSINLGIAAHNKRNRQLKGINLCGINTN